ncbi:MAG: glycine--tRNA ligase subunit beta [Rhodospirillales bacterium]|nr:glycine--tRNA ligase subunit beta [Rhodospirillales bacterium]
MAELLLEILSEEIPARMQARAADDLKRLMCDGLKAAGLDFDNARSFVTPRRLVFVAAGIPESTPDISEERKGPATDAPEQALNGFLGSIGLTLDQCEKREIKGREFYFAMIEKKGIESGVLIALLVSDTLRNFPWQKSMRWGTVENRWVRPIHRISILFGGQPIDANVGFNGPDIESFITFGHRFLSPEPITVTNFADYQDKLRAARVMIDPAERRDLIASKSAELAASEGLTVKDDPALLAEVAGLVEWPVTLMGKIDDQFMDLPAEVLVTSMRSHQKYFSCLDADGNFANRFIVVANTETKDNGAQVIAGNERVLSARLSDARFFWDTDRAQTLASRAPALKDRVFHAKLGTLDAKVDRIQALAADLAASVPGAEKDMVRSAARLSKADLSTGMVGEFPELQGIMGRYYALNDGESTAVADAIAEHYAPQGPGDACPTKPISICVSLADKVDTLVGFFGIDEKPTGSKDPFALRRAALGVIRLIIENGLRIPLADLFAAASKHY